jgi:hypothetical protein
MEVANASTVDDEVVAVVVDVVVGGENASATETNISKDNDFIIISPSL